MRTSTANDEPNPGSATDPEEVARLRLGILRLARRLRQQVHSGITPSQLSALAVLEGRGPLTLGELAAFENVRPPSMSRIVDGLEDEGYASRTTDPTDRRLTLLEATDKARQELAQLRAERNEWLATQLEALDPADRDLLLAALPAFERLAAGEEPS